MLDIVKMEIERISNTLKRNGFEIKNQIATEMILLNLVKTNTVTLTAFKEKSLVTGKEVSFEEFADIIKSVSCEYYYLLLCVNGYNTNYEDVLISVRNDIEKILVGDIKNFCFISKTFSILLKDVLELSELILKK